ncbi:baseplate J/gp47 family protein [Kurthia sp. Dielmo]|uniref:baseplate J/gp47 family protein n=1 Tax=Kurthia sp. Dielmo TaxID=1033738 RepID=UPI00112131EE|nr:baseplate J/gp47 family protein [Kurthia sp. Dielmo]
MKTASTIKQDIKNNMNVDFYEGSFIDNVLNAIADSEEKVYEEVDKARSPYLYSQVLNFADNLDDLGQMYNLVREEGESDQNYLYRIINWKLISEAGNKTAIQASIINPVNASYMEYLPLTNGANTGSIYIVPNDYEVETKLAAIEEAKKKIEAVVSPGMYMEYVIPDMVAIDLDIKIETSNSNQTLLKSAVNSAIREYVNNIAPNDYLTIGALNRIGINLAGVDYFNVTQVYIGGSATKSNKNLQEIDKKFVLNLVSWD